MGSRRISLHDIPSPREQKPVDKLQKALQDVEKEIDYMAKLEQTMYMSGSLMGMRYDAPVLYEHVMSYK